MLNVTKIKYILIFLIFGLLSPNIFAWDLSIENPYLKIPRPGQDISVGFVKLVTTKNVQIKSIESRIIEKIEVHTMKMENDSRGEKIMKMRKIENPQLIANEEFILKPGADHLMFFGIKKILKPGDTVSLVFNFLDQDKLTPISIDFFVIN